MIALLFGASILWETVFEGKSVPGYPSLVVGLMVLGGVQLIMIGIMGEYIGKVLSEIKARPVYFVAEHSVRTAPGPRRYASARRSSHRRRMSVAAASAEARPIWLCADDYGISPAVSKAIRDLVVQGRLNATSVMVAAPSFDRSEAGSLKMLNAGARRVAIGLHVTLTGPFKPMSPGFRPTRDGTFLSLAEMMVRGTAAAARPQHARHRDRDAAREPSSTQFGQPPDFVDGHQHVHLFPQVREALLDVVKEMAPQAWVRQCGGVRALAAADLGLQDADSRCAEPKVPRAGGGSGASRPIRRLPAPMISAGRPRRISRGCSRAFSASLPARSVVMCHPGFVDAELERLDPLTTQREREYAYLAGEAFPAVLRAHGVALA